MSEGHTAASLTGKEPAALLQADGLHSRHQALPGVPKWIGDSEAHSGALTVILSVPVSVSHSQLQSKTT